MKKVTLIIALFLAIFTLQAQQDAYIQAMQEALTEMGSCQNAEGYAKTAALFERISTVAPDQWHPAYYASLSYIQAGFNSKEGTVIDAYLDKAQEHLDKLSATHPNEAELTVLQAFTYLARIQVDPMSRGMEFSPKAAGTLEKALKQNPTNPRAMYLKAMNVMNIPDFMGGGKEQACPLFQEAKEAFGEYESPSPFSPSWGKETTEKLAASCK